MKRILVKRVPVTDVKSRFADGGPRETTLHNTTPVYDGEDAEFLSMQVVVDRHEITAVLVLRVDVPDEEASK